MVIDQQEMAVTLREIVKGIEGQKESEGQIGSVTQRENVAARKESVASIGMVDQVGIEEAGHVNDPHNHCPTTTDAPAATPGVATTVGPGVCLLSGKFISLF